jgi:hypothetical protein
MCGQTIHVSVAYSQPEALLACAKGTGSEDGGSRVRTWVLCVQINPGCQTVGVMRSYPCLIPLSAGVVQRIQAKLARVPPYETAYGAWWYAVMKVSDKFGG